MCSQVNTLWSHVFSPHYSSNQSLTYLTPGKVSVLEDAALDSFRSQISRPIAKDDSDPKMKLTAHDVYKELRLRGYDYGKTFQGILESNNAGVCAPICVCFCFREMANVSLRTAC